MGCGGGEENSAACEGTRMGRTLYALRGRCRLRDVLGSLVRGEDCESRSKKPWRVRAVERRKEKRGQIIFFTRHLLCCFLLFLLPLIDTPPHPHRTQQQQTHGDGRRSGASGGTRRRTARAPVPGTQNPGLPSLFVFVCFFHHSKILKTALLHCSAPSLASGDAAVQALAQRGDPHAFRAGRPGPPRWR